MVALSRKPHADAEAPAETPAGPPKPVVENLRELYDYLAPHLDGWRVDVIDGSLVVSPLGTPKHQRHAYKLAKALDAHAEAKGWLVYVGLDVVLPDSRHPYLPDFAMAPEGAPLWGDREVFTDGLIMVGEVVSEGSANHDRNKKPEIYAKGGVPVMLRIDPLTEPPSVTVYGGLEDGRYTSVSTVELGQKLRIPEPVDFVLDTEVFRTA